MKWFENWLYQKMSIAKKCSWIGIIQWKKEKDSDDFWHRKLTLKVKLWHFLTARQNSKIFIGYVDSEANILLMYPPFTNSTILTAILHMPPQQNHTIITSIQKKKFSLSFFSHERKETLLLHRIKLKSSKITSYQNSSLDLLVFTQLW